MSIRTDLENLTELELLEAADLFCGAGPYLKSRKLPNKGQYTVIVNSLMKFHNIKWKSRNSKYKTISKSCPICKEEFKTLNGGTEERFTCGYSCSNTYFRSGKNNGMYKSGNSTNYRNKAFVELPNLCNRCNVEDKEVLVVHHKDRNRNNNDISNLEILCANCHMKEHKSQLSGRS